MKWLDGITNAMDTNLGKLQEMVTGREARQVNNEKQLLSTWIQPMSSYQSDVTERRVGKMLHSRISFELNIMKN